MERISSDESTTEMFQRKIKLSLFQTYYKIVSNQFQLKFLYILILLYELFVNLILIVFNITYSEYDKTQYSLVKDYVTVFRIIILLYPNNNYYYACGSLYIYFSLFLIQFLTYIFNFIYEIKKNKRMNFFRRCYYKILLFLNMLYNKFLFFPILITIFSMFQCKSSNNISIYINYPDMECAGFIYYFNISICILSLIMFLLISLANAMFFNDNRPITILPWGNPSNTLQFLYLSLKFILCFFYVMNISNLQFDFKIILIILLIVVIIICRFMNPLYHHKIVFNLSVYTDGIMLFFAFFSLINKYTGEVYTSETLMLFLITSFCFGLLSLNLFHRLQNYYKYKNSEDINSASVAFNKIILLIEDAKEFKISNYKKSIFLGLLQKHRIKCLIKNCKCHTYLRVLNVKNFQNVDKKNNSSDKYKKKIKKIIFDGEKVENEDFLNLTKESNDFLDDNYNDLSINECVFGTIKIYLEEFIEKFPKNTELIIIYIYLVTYYLDNVYKSLFEIMKLSKRKYGIFNEFKLF